MLQINNLTFRYGPEEILKDFTYSFSPGLIYGLRGVSGAGKSTLSKLISGQLLPSSGSIVLEGQPLENKMSRKSILVNQDNDLFAWQTVSETVDFFKDEKENSEELLQLVNLQDHRDQYPKELSGGMKKRLSLCRALGANPQVIVLDELFSSQDMKLQEDLFRRLSERIKARNQILIIISHDKAFLEAHCDSVFSLS